jgi:fumarate hydratase, class II
MRAKARTAGDGRHVPTRVIRFPPATMKTRVEIDSMGPIEVSADRYWGAQTERWRINFRIGEERMPRPLIVALAIVKRAAAESNLELGLLDTRRARTIIKVADEIIAGKLDDHFPRSFGRPDRARRPI